MDTSATATLDACLESCLPLSLQHLSIIALLNDIKSYPVELLASLPCWLRRSLLENLPALDLCLLDGTAVAEGINMDKIWKSRYGYIESSYCCIPGRRKRPLVSANYDNMSMFVTYEPRLAAAMDNTGTWRERFLLSITQYVLRYGTISHAALLLLAINGRHLLKNLVILDEESLEEADVQNFFMKQGNVLRSLRGDNFLLIPQRYMAMQSNITLSQLLSLLAESCGLQPTYLHLDRMLRSSRTAASIPLCADSDLKHLMRRLVMIKLSKINRNYLRQLFEAVVGDGWDCQLLGLSLSDYCVHKEELECLSPYLLTLPSDFSPPRYQGLTVLQLRHALHPSSLPYLTALLQQQLSLKVVAILGFFPWPAESQTTNIISVLSSLFSRPAFQSLSLSWPNISAAQTMEIVRGFMSSHCSDTQELLIAQQNDPATLDPTIVASLEASKKVERAVSDCGVEHKVIQSTDSLLYAILPQLTVRLRELELNCGKNHNIIHLAAIHPDLRVSTLTLKFHLQQVEPGLSSLTDDITTLLVIPTLKEMTLDGHWTNIKEVKKGLLAGLKEQARVGSIRKLSLLTNGDTTYTKPEFVELWDSIFSLTPLNQLEVIIGEGLAEKVKQSVDNIYASWCRLALGKKLKSVNFCAYKGELDILEDIGSIYSTECIDWVD